MLASSPGWLRFRFRITAVLVRIQSRHQRRPSRTAERRRAKRVVEANALACEAVDVRGLDDCVAGRSKRRVMQLVGNDQQDVRPLGRPEHRRGCRTGGRGKHRSSAEVRHGTRWRGGSGAEIVPPLAAGSVKLELFAGRHERWLVQPHWITRGTKNISLLPRFGRFAPPGSCNRPP